MNSITPFGKFVRKLRIDHSISMKDQARDLEVSPSYLSSVESGKKPINIALINSIVDFFNLSKDQELQLIQAAAQSGINTVSINTSDSETCYLAILLAQKLQDKSFDRNSLKSLLLS